MTKKLVIFGEGDFAELACFYFRQAGREVAGFTVDGAYQTRAQVLGLPVMPFEEAGARFPPEAAELFISIGYSKVNRVRRDKFLLARRLGYRMASCISPQAVVHSAQVGENCLILDMNNFHPYTRIGDNVIFSHANHVGHHAVIGDHCFFTSGNVICGRAVVGEGTFLGLRACVWEGVRVGAYNVIGAGVDVHADTADEAVFTLPHVAPRPFSSRDMEL